MFKKSFTILILLLLSLFLVGAECGEDSSKRSKSKQEDKFENYLTYQNQKWDFEIKYPKDWKKEEEDQGDNGFSVTLVTPQEGPDDMTSENVIVFASSPEPEDFDELMALVIEEFPQDPNAELFDYSRIMISGYPSYKLDYTYGDYHTGKLRHQHYFINTGDIWYQVLFTTLESTYSDYSEQFEIIINSLKLE